MKLTKRQKQLKAIRDKSAADKKVITTVYYNNPHTTIRQLGELVGRSEYFAAKAVKDWLFARMENKRA